MKVFRKLLILSHRYLGILFSLLVMVWFASGIVMMYAGGMPTLTAEERLERRPNLDVAAVRVTPADAGRLAGGRGRLQLLTVMDRPAYRSGNTTVFADDGQVLMPLDASAAKTVASRFLRVPEDRVHLAATLDTVDQWTLGQGRAMPLHKFTVDDDVATEVYVASHTGEISALTTRRTRALAWIGTIPHWLYFAAIRTNQPLWYQLVVWTSAAACLITVLGLVLGVTQFRKTRPFRLAKAVPYWGWMRWHYITGVVFGVFTLTWAFSGLLSMEPFEWTNATGLEAPPDTFTGGPVDLEAFAMPDADAWRRVLDGQGVKEIEFARIQDEHYFIVRPEPEASSDATRERLHQPYGISGRTNRDRVLVAADTMQVRHDAFSLDDILGRLRAALPDAPIVESQMLSEYDSYYYSRAGQAPLPVARVKFGDPADTWFYIDPDVSQIVAEVNRLNRVERWLYNGLHSLDFSFWYSRRPLWDIGMIVLLVGGLASSSIGFFLGLKRTWRAIQRS